jgi:Protein kinase domain
MASQPERSRVGTMFGRYEIRSRIGAGGMGEVYQAYDTSKGRIVAIKLLRPELAAHAGFQERFRRESRLAACLQEPHVIPVHDWGEINGVLYIDMRFVEGSNVYAVLRRAGPFPPARAVSIITQVAGALDAAHAGGLVHRDVKPENILLTPKDFAYLVDFGIAHLGGESGITSAGSAIGSFAYMAPERFTGDAVGPQADVYSLACVLYECLTGQPPFPPGDMTQMMAAHLMRPPPRPSAVRPELGPAFDDVIARGMAKRPELRFTSAGELARAVTDASHAATRQFSQPWPRPAAAGYPPHGGQPVAPAAHASRSGFGRLPLALALAAAAMLTAAGVGVLWLLIKQGPSANDEGPTPTMPLTTTERTNTAPALTASLPGTDGGGFVNYPGARCDPGNEPAVLARTDKSVLVVCRAGPGSYYYRGVRLSDSAGIELSNAVRSSGGFDVTNPTDGTRYEIRRSGLTIVQPDGQRFVEPMLEYASN